MLDDKLKQRSELKVLPSMIKRQCQKQEKIYEEFIFVLR